jgi:hypothetical protein
LVEFLGTTYVALNQIKQIQYEFDDIGDSSKLQEESFLLEDEIL